MILAQAAIAFGMIIMLVLFLIVIIALPAALGSSYKRLRKRETEAVARNPEVVCHSPARAILHAGMRAVGIVFISLLIFLLLVFLYDAVFQQLKVS